MDRARAVFTVFGPLYRFRPKFRSIVGFAQPWIIYPRNECFAMLPLGQRLKTRLKYRIQGWFFRRADLLVVELEHVRQGLVRELGIPEERIHVVHNCLSRVFLQPELWQPAPIPEADCDLRLGFLGRDYLHKNTRIFPEIVARLERDHNIRAKIHVTFTPEEWAAATPEFRAACVNVGPLAITQCPSFYCGLDAVVFPSLLECFSATPLEAMAMERPLFASDRPFNRDVCGPHAHYFDPMSAKSAAQAIADVFGRKGPDAKALRCARVHATNFSNPADRAMRYLSLLEGRASAPPKP
jgi:glycosyltransferase involved in cell wall biosynthesis